MVSDDFALRTQFNKLFEPPSKGGFSASRDDDNHEVWIRNIYELVQSPEIYRKSNNGTSHGNNSEGDLTLKPGNGHRAMRLPSPGLLEEAWWQSMSNVTIPPRSEGDNGSNNRNLQNPTIQVPPFTNTSFNPNAAAFVPAVTNASYRYYGTQPAFVPKTIPKFSGSNVPSRFKAFLLGVSTTDAGYQQQCASYLIRSVHWDDESVAKLAQQFCLKSTEGLQQHIGAALFARAVYTQFQLKFGRTREFSIIFASNLHACTVDMLNSYWQSDVYPNALALGRTCSLPQLSAALGIIAFLGDLYVQRMGAQHTIHELISMLLSNLSAIEHVYAIHALIQHSGETLWQKWGNYRLMHDFVNNFAIAVGHIAENASVVGHKFPLANVQHWRDETISMVVRWQAQAGQESSQSRSTENNGGRA